MSKRSKTPEEIVNDIRTACAALGWAIGMDESDTHVSGLVIGQTNYVEGLLNQIDDMENYGVFDPGATDVSLQ